jgi:hypothetical protein
LNSRTKASNLACCCRLLRPGGERSAAGVAGGSPRRATDGRRPRIHRGRRLQPMPICAPFGLFQVLQTVFVHYARHEVTEHGDSAERMRAPRERQRRGLRKLRIEVSEDDLRQIAQAGYEGAVSSDHDQQAQADDGFSAYLSSICARATRLAASVREREISVSFPIASSVIANSTACRHLAMMPVLV